MSYDYSSDYVRHFPRADLVFEDELIAEVRRLQAEVDTLKATLRLVRSVVEAAYPPGDLTATRIIENLGTV